MGIPELTAYDVFYKIMKKYSGFCAATEWPYEDPKTNERIKAGEGFKLLWGVITRNLVNLIISTDPSPIITGDLTINSVETVESKIQRLKACIFPHGYYLLLIFNFEESLEVRWFKTKQEALERREWVYENEEMLFFCRIVKV